jgi:hypothetical protein
MVNECLTSGVGILLFEAQVEHGDRSAPATDHAVKAEVIFCVSGVISPLLANVYLHFVLDQWIERDVKPRLRGKVIVIRYADDGAPRRREEEVAM